MPATVTMAAAATIDGLVMSEPASEAAVLEFFGARMPYGIAVPDDSPRTRFKGPRPVGNCDSPYMYVIHRMASPAPLDNIAAAFLEPCHRHAYARVLHG
jgi:hypothetical protein